MNEQAIYEQYHQILSLLKQKRLGEAHSHLEALLFSSNDWKLRNRLELAQVSYRYMLQYMRQGINDPERRNIYHRLLIESLEIADQTRISLLDEISKHHYHTLRRERKNRTNENLSDLLKILEAFPEELALYQLMPDNKQGLDTFLQRHEEAARKLFELTWINCEWSGEEERQMQACLTSELLPVNDLCLLTSAVMLSLITCFDARKFAWLLEATTHIHTQVNQRAVVAVAILLHIYADRLLLYPELKARFSLLGEDTRFAAALNRVYIQLLRSQDTSKLEKRMREEIIPEMMKGVDMMRNQKFGFEENVDEEDWNPDWEKRLKESALGEKIREMSELQLEGADIYMSTFSHLKNYPFFQTLSNWFYPFDATCSYVVRDLGLKPTGENAVVALMLQSAFFCNSDKYSLCFTLKHIPPSQRKLMLNQMGSEELNEMLDEHNASDIRQGTEKPEVVSNQYIHDLYRFLKLYPRRGEFRDIFHEEIVLHRNPVVRELLNDLPLKREVADFHFSKEHYAQALDIYQTMEKKTGADFDLFQKIGFCLQKEKRYSEAVEAYSKANILNPDHLWTLRHLATCYRKLHDSATALNYYQKAADFQPENPDLIFFIGSCFAELERYEEALHYFFKLDFMEGDNIKVWRAIGWCLFVSGKHLQAQKYYAKILQLKPLASDYLNAGHVAWCLGDIQQAVTLYNQSVKASGSKETFHEMFCKDKAVLLKQGIEEEDIPLMRDLIDREE